MTHARGSIPWCGVGWSGSRAAALAPGSPAPHHEAQLPRANTALPSPQLGNEGETRIANRIRFVCADLKEIGQIQKRTVGEKGVWRLSDAGRERLFRAAKILYEDKTTGVQVLDDLRWERFTPEFLALIRKLGEERNAGG